MGDASPKEGQVRMSNEKKQWPFKHLSQKSSWPMQGFVVNFAAAVLQAPKGEQKKVARKMVERCMRMGARLAREFEISPVKVLKIAQEQIEREIPGSKPAIAEAKLAEHEEVTEMAEAIVSGQLSSLFGKKDTGEA